MYACLYQKQFELVFLMFQNTPFRIRATMPTLDPYPVLLYLWTYFFENMRHTVL